jgi:hypothetical protein
MVLSLQYNQVGCNLHAFLQAWMVVSLLWHLDVAGPLGKGDGRVHTNRASTQVEICIHIACETLTLGL